ncbi:MAG: winged helix-turn-helix transcriptional regulator [Proteobacteria bacterium]|uniref:MarR family winged helix-turn-helix transcriptional regulator n=1 Tax=Rudaea sp. TaxID=2136325 RepID=UPI00321F99C6|nr:winged helix-turn-helix transcriptional regulator [Pseudomonadota bacterium]
MSSHQAELKKVVAMLQSYRRHVDENASLKAVLVFLTVALEPGSDQVHIGEVSGLHRAVVSKYIADLTALTSTKQPGPGLVENAIDPRNLRYRYPRLTPKGERVLEKIVKETFG